MKLRLCLWILCLLCAVCHLPAQQLTFLNSSLADALTAIDERYPETRIHFVYNDLEALLVSAHLSDDLDAETAVRAIVGMHPVKITAYREHIFVEYLHARNATPVEMLLPEPERPAITILLHNIDVEHDLPTLQLKSDQTTLQIAGSTLSNAGSAFDLLSFLPGLHADDPSVIYYIDGLPVSNLSQLTQLGSEQISRIEYATNGGHAIRASKSRVVNIITRIGQQRGIQARLHTRLSKGKSATARQSAALDVHHKHFDVLTQADYERDGVHKELRINQQPHPESYVSHALSLSAAMNIRLAEGHSAGFQYKHYDLINDINLQYFDLFSNYIPGPSYDHNGFGSNTGISKLSDWSMHFAPRHDLNAYYRANLPALSLRMGFNYYHDGMTISNIEHGLNQHKHQQNQASNTLKAVMAEGEYRLAKGQISFGAEYSHTLREEAFLRYDDMLRSWRTRKQNRVNALLAYSHQATCWNAEAGLRFEHTDDYYGRSRLFPFLNIGMSGQNRRQLSLSYAMHSAMPTYAQTNSYMHHDIELLNVAGNPFLRPATVHQVSIQAQLSDFLLTADFQQISDYVASYISTARQDVYSLSYKNLSDVPMLDASLSYSHRFFGRWHTQASATMHAQWLTFRYEHSSKQFSTPLASFTWHNQIRLPWQLLATVDLNISTKGHRSTTWQNQSSQLDVGLQKTLRDWSFQFRVTDLIHDAYQFTQTFGDNITYSRHCYADRQRIAFSMKYSFGSQKQQRRYEGVNAGSAERERMK